MATNTLVCPVCRTDNHVVGVEVRGIYDGVLYWHCDMCGSAWPRFQPPDDRYLQAHVQISGYRDDA